VGCWVLLAIELAIFLFLIAGTYGLIVPLDKPTTSDFVSFYAAGDLADAGEPQLAYHQAAHYAAEQRATKPGIEYDFFYYPPVFLMLCAAFPRLPYLVALGVFEAVTLAFFLLVASRIMGDRVVFLALFAFPPLLWNIGLGQNAFLTAGLFGAGTLLVDRRPITAGLIFGALCYKPHFGLLIPIALAAGGRWRAFAAAFAAALALCVASLILFGWQTWHDFLAAAVASPGVYESGRVTLAGFVTPFGAARLLSGSPAIGYVFQAGVTLAAGALVAVVWRRDLPLPIRAAALAAATLAAVPLALFYDLMLAAVAGMWLLRADGDYRLPEWGKVALVALFVLSLNPRGLADAWHVPAGTFITMALLALVATIALRDRRILPRDTVAATALSNS